METPVSIAYLPSGHREREERSPSALPSPRPLASRKLAEDCSCGGIDRSFWPSIYRHWPALAIPTRTIPL